MATLKDIAEKTGLSIGTISRVLNYDQSLIISDEKKMLILKTADELNYKTLQERKLEEGRILILQTSSKSYEIQDPYFMSIKTGAENYAQYKKINFESKYLEEINLSDLKNYLGVVVIGLLDSKNVDRVTKANKNVVFVENNPLTGTYTSVNVDLPKISRDVAEYFSLEKSTVVYFGPLSTKERYDLRQQAFQSASLYYGLKYQEVQTSMDVIDSYANAVKFLTDNRENKLNIFCANDNVALGVLRAVTELELSIPSQIQIIGINNIPATEFSTPPLSTIEIPSEFMGEYGLKVLMDSIENNIEVAINHVVSTKLLHRSTTNKM